MESTVQTKMLVPAIRVQGKWYRVHAKPYEPERQTYTIAYQIAKGTSPQVAYREWFAQERKDAKLLYPSFGKNE